MGDRAGQGARARQDAARARALGVRAPRLVLTMFEDVLEHLARRAGHRPHPRRDGGPDDATLGERKGATILREGRSSGLNAACGEERAMRCRARRQRVLFIPADVPLATAAEIGRIVSGASAPGPRSPGHRSGARLVGAPMRSCFRLPMRFRRAFGEDSFARHCRQALERGLEPRKCCGLRGLSRDIDEPSDLAALFEAKRGSSRYAFLHAALRNLETVRETSPRTL